MCTKYYKVAKQMIAATLSQVLLKQGGTLKYELSW